MNRRIRTKGFTLIELLVVVAIIALLISILLPSLARARELAKRAVCAANLRGIGQSAYIYSNDYNERFPVDLGGASPAGGTDPGVQFSGQMAQDATTSASEDLTNATGVSVGRSLFLLIIEGATSPGQFICPSSSDTKDDLRNEDTGNPTAANVGVDRFDFKSYNNLSYGYQMPLSRVAPPSTSLDVRMALAADKGPYFQGESMAFKTAAVEPLTGLDDPPSNALDANNTDWEQWNSPNHGQEGQQILFVDGHVDFERTPAQGPDNDNIYTYADENYSDLDGIMVGNLANGTEGPTTSTDSFIVP